MTLRRLINRYDDTEFENKFDRTRTALRELHELSQFGIEELKAREAMIDFREVMRVSHPLKVTIVVDDTDPVFTYLIISGWEVANEEPRYARQG